MLRNIYLEGEMGERFGTGFQVNAPKIADVIKCIECNHPDFRGYLIECHEKNIGFEVDIANNKLDYAEELLMNLQEGDVTITPLAAGSKSGGGKIVNITSIQGIRGYKGSIAYNTAKGGLINMTRVLAVELAEKNILVNSVAPGFINTPMAIMKDGVFEGDTDWFQDVYMKYEKLPMQRYGQPDDIAGAVYFFCCEDSKYVTGQTLLVDGGVSTTF